MRGVGAIGVDGSVGRGVHGGWVCGEKMGSGQRR